MWAIEAPYQANVTGSGLSTANKARVAGWLYGDEMDGHTCSQETAAPPSEGDLHRYAYLTTSPTNLGACSNGPTQGVISPTYLKGVSNNLRATDGTRPVMMGYTHPWAWNQVCESPCADYTNAADVLGYDVYCLVDPRHDAISTNLKPWCAYDSVQLARVQSGKQKPIWPDVETSETDYGFNTTIKPTGAQVQALAWNYMIGGARGITYFAICICGAITSFDTLDDNTNWPGIHAATKTVDGQIQGLASVLNSDFANSYVSVTSGQANVMAKWVPSEGTNGTFYVFASARQDASQNVTFHLTGISTATATGVGPSNGSSWSVTSGNVTVPFADGNTIQIFKVANP
jgi:hypothetical protein